MSDNDFDDSAESGFSYNEFLEFITSSFKYIFLPLPKKNNVDIWTREGFPYKYKLTNSFLASFLGMGSTIPMDLVRHLYFMYKSWPKSLRKFRYTSGFSCLYHTTVADSFLGMYKPAFFDICMRTPKTSIKMFCNDFYGFKLTSPRGEYPPINRFIAAILTGLSQAIVASPFEMYRYRFWQRTHGERAWFLGPVTNKELMAQILSPAGRSHWGMVLRAMCLESVCFSFIYFPLQHYLQKTISANETRGGPWVSFVTGWMAATVSNVIVTPLDCIKKQVVRIPDYTDLYACPGDKPDYTNLRHAYRRMIRASGYKVLFRGIWCRVGVKARIYGVIQLVYDLNIMENLASKERTFKTLDDFKEY